MIEGHVYQVPRQIVWIIVAICSEVKILKPNFSKKKKNSCHSHQILKMGTIKLWTQRNVRKNPPPPQRLGEKKWKE